MLRRILKMGSSRAAMSYELPMLAARDRGEPGGRMGHHDVAARGRRGARCGGPPPHLAT